MVLSTRRVFVSLLFIAIFIMAAREVSDPDFWWHLRTGQYIVETKNVPHTDIFSFTAAGKEWVAHEWLSEVLIYVLFRAGGFALLIGAFAAIITAALALAYRQCEARPYLPGFVVLFGALATAPTWGVRPQMFTFLLTSLFLFLLERHRESGETRWIAPLAPFMILWVNLHSGFALGIVLVAVYLFVALIKNLRGRGQPTEARGVRGLSTVLLLSSAAVMLNPNGARMYSYPLETLTSPAMQRYIQEWFSPDFHLIEFQPFGLLLIALIGAAMWSRAQVPVTSIILLIVFAYASLRSARNIPIFVLIAIPVLTRQLAEAFQRQGWQLERVPSVALPRVQGFVNVALLLVALGAAVVRMIAVSANQPAVEQANFPVLAVNWIDSTRPPPNIYNSYGWGGYLIWRLYPAYRVYIDGRADVYGDTFIEDFLKIYRAEPGWSDRLAERDVRLVLVEPDSPLALALTGDSNWQRVFSDARSALFEKK